MRKYLLLAATAGLLAAPALAQTADHAAHSPKAGPQTRVELQQHIAQRFAALDTNKDGAVTKAEFDAHRAAMKQKWEQHKKERRDAFFARADTNKDGQISKAEFDAAGTARDAHRAHGPRSADNRPMGHHGRHGMKPGMGGPGMMKHHGDMFAMMDANKDGKVTLAEMSARPLAMFDKADANKDGTVTPEERRAAWQNMRAQWRAKAPPAAKAG